MISVRFESDVARQAGNAALAAATAASTSSTEAKSTSLAPAGRSPGRRPGPSRPDVPATMPAADPVVDGAERRPACVSARALPGSATCVISPRPCPSVAPDGSGCIGDTLPPTPAFRASASPLPGGSGRPSAAGCDHDRRWTPQTRRLTGAQIVVEYLVRQGVPLAAGIPGHGCWALTDALLDRRDAIRTVQVMHEQSAVHLADGYYRATGRPMLAFTSIGPGATNTVVGMGTAYVDSTAVALMTGSAAHVHARPRPAPGARAPPRRRQPADLRAGRQGVVAAVAGRRAAVRPPPGVERDDRPGGRGRSCSTSPMDVQAEAADVRHARSGAARGARPGPARPPTTSSGPRRSSPGRSDR